MLRAALALGALACCARGAGPPQCDFKRLDGRKPVAAKIEKTHRPLLITHGFPWREGMASREAFLGHFGDHNITVVDDLNYQARKGIAGSSHQQTISQWAHSPPPAGNDTSKYFFGWLSMADHYALSSAILGQYDIPEALQSWLTLDRFLVLGSRPEGSRTKGFALHNHLASQVTLLAGEKLWFVFPPSAEPPVEPYKTHSEEVLADADGVQVCLQRASEIVVLPRRWWHATLDRQSWTVGLGGQAGIPGGIELIEGKGDGRIAHLASVGSSAGLAGSPTREALGVSLQAAATSGHHGLVQELLDRGADAQVADKNGGQPLHRAIFRGHRGVVELLLDRRADVHSALAWGDKPIHSAALNGHTDLVRLLLDRGADINAADSKGTVPLHHAAKAGQADVARMLLGEGASVNGADRLGKQPLHLAAQSGHEAVAGVLLGARADLAAKDVSQRAAALHTAVTEGHAAIVGLLLDHRASPSAKDGRGTRPDALASEHGHAAVAKLLEARSRTKHSEF